MALLHTPSSRVDSQGFGGNASPARPFDARANDEEYNQTGNDHFYAELSQGMCCLRSLPSWLLIVAVPINSCVSFWNRCKNSCPDTKHIHLVLEIVSKPRCFKSGSEWLPLRKLRGRPASVGKENRQPTQGTCPRIRRRITRTT